jgi:hypothetical protein
VVMTPDVVSRVHQAPELELHLELLERSILRNSGLFRVQGGESVKSGPLRKGSQSYTPV